LINISGNLLSYQKALAQKPMKKISLFWAFTLVMLTIVVGTTDMQAQEPLPAVINRTAEFITPLQMEFLNTIYDLYRTGNSLREDGCLDFEGGVQSVLDFLKSKIGSRYNDEYGFSGFDFKFISTLEQADPPGAPDVSYEKTETMGIISGKHVGKLYGSGPPYYGQPWLSATVQSRDCTSFVDGVSTHRVEVFDYTVVAYLLPLLQGSAWSMQFESDYSDNPAPHHPDPIIQRTLTRVTGQFQVPELADSSIWYDAPGWEGWGEDSATQKNVAQGESKITASEGTKFKTNMLGRLEPVETCSSLEHSMAVHMKIHVGALIHPQAAFITVLFQPVSTATSRNIEQMCAYLDTGQPSLRWVAHYSIKPVSDDILFRIGIDTNHFADAYAIMQGLIARYEQWGATAETLKTAPLPEDTRQEFQLGSGSFYLNRDEWDTRGGNWKVSVKLERNFSQTIYDQPVKHRSTK
jgi:hypothetical protein